MSLFGRGNWSIFGVEPESLNKFQENLQAPLPMVKVSQVVALAMAKFHGEPTVGINPFGSPRLDEGVENPTIASDICRAIEGEEPVSLDPIKGFLSSEESLSLGNKAYAFWVVFNDNKDVSDPASKKEGLAYDRMNRPFRFLNKEEKTSVEAEVKADAVMSRKQYPVLLDFQHGRAYAETTSKDDILALRDILTELGVKTFSLMWSFGDHTWVTNFLNQVTKDTRFRREIASRADELAHRRPEEIEKLEDKALEQIVSSYFAFTPLDNGLVAALGCPSQVLIHKIGTAVGVTNPSTAFSLLGLTDDSGVSEASLTVVEPVIKTTKKGEKTINKPVLSVSIGENITCFDAGAALLKGLDLPQFKRHCKTAAKANNGMEIKDFWSLWLSGLHDATLTVADVILSTLNLKGDGNYGLVIFENGAEDASSESPTATEGITELKIKE